MLLVYGSHPATVVSIWTSSASTSVRHGGRECCSPVRCTGLPVSAPRSRVYTESGPPAHAAVPNRYRVGQRVHGVVLAAGAQAGERRLPSQPPPLCRQASGFVENAKTHTASTEVTLGRCCRGTPIAVNRQHLRRRLGQELDQGLSEISSYSPYTPDLQSPIVDGQTWGISRQCRE